MVLSQIQRSWSLYEICCDLVQDRTVWADGPCTASAHDRTIFHGGNRTRKKNGNSQAFTFTSHLVKTHRWFWICRGGHKNFDNPWCSLKASERLFCQSQIKGWNYQCKVQNFKILGTTFWHHGKHGGGIKEKIQVHRLIFDAISVVSQYDLENGNPLFDM